MTFNEKLYIAHRREDSEDIQTIQQHSEQTAVKAAAYAIEPMKQLVFAAGIFHDVGKYGANFQRRIKGDQTIHAPHALCGAQAVKRYYGKGPARRMMQYVIAGHHAGLPDYGDKSNIPEDATLYGTLKRDTDDYSAYEAELAIPSVSEEVFKSFLFADCHGNERAEKFAFFTRYAFSCLTDADSLDTEAFCRGLEREKLHVDFHMCLDKVNQKLNSFQCCTPLQETRAKLQAQAFQRAGRHANIYLMNMPTGSGKTLCSLKFALERVKAAGKKRIIYIIPYNSIIDQTAASFENLLGDSVEILRHQSTFVYEDAKDLDEETRVNRIRATENWDAPLVITTAVQFFQSLYANRRSGLRKLHNMADAVLIFDEAHLMPYEYLQPCLKGIAYITKYLNSEALLLTATMPDYHTLFRKFGLEELTLTDLIPDRKDFAVFRKCSYQQLGTLSDEALIAMLMEQPSGLLIVNSRKAARKLYQMIPDGWRKFHLSTWMTALDRKDTIQRIREALADVEARYPDGAEVPPEERVMVVSTSLVEAGVDVDFHTVFRELTGLDSILQSGGRCNREGKRPDANTYIFEREESVGSKHADARINVTRGLIAEFDDIDTPVCILQYYEGLYEAHKDRLDSHSIVRFGEKMECYEPSRPMQLPFRSYTRDFKLIDNTTYAIAVAQDEVSQKLIAKIPYGLESKERRQLQKYSCSVTPHDFEELLKQHLVAVDESGLCWLTNNANYHRDTGLQFECEDCYT